MRNWLEVFRMNGRASGSPVQRFSYFGHFLLLSDLSVSCLAQLKVNADRASIIRNDGASLQ